MKLRKPAQYSPSFNSFGVTIPIFLLMLTYTDF